MRSVLAVLIATIGGILALCIAVPGIIEVGFGILVGWVFFTLAAMLHSNRDIDNFLLSVKQEISKWFR